MSDTKAAITIQGLTILVEILNLRSAYGRYQAEIQPLHGSGKKWVNIDSLSLNTPHNFT